MIITGYITCFNGHLVPESTLIVDGVEYPIPPRTRDGSIGAEFRIIQTVEKAGFRTAGPYWEALSGVAESGGYEIRLLKR